MNTAPRIPDFPGGLEHLLAPGLAETLSTFELGAAYRLLRFAWRQQPPCTIPDEDSSLAAVAGATSEEWARSRTRLLLALGGTQPPPRTTGNEGGTPERITLGYARSVYQDRAAVEAKRTADRRAAGIASAKARLGVAPIVAGLSGTPPPNGRSTAVQRPFNSRSTAVDDAPTVRSSPSDALALQRSSFQELNPSAPRARGEDVCAILGDGARARLDGLLAEWRRTKAKDMLEQAIRRWIADGHTTFPLTHAARLAACRHASPARVEYLIQDADTKIESARASTRRRSCNPIGVVINGLGESAARRTPVEVPMFVMQRWDHLESMALRLLEARAAADAARDAGLRIGTHTPQTGGIAARRGCSA